MTSCASRAETRSASACNHRRDALTNLVKTLYGRRAAAEFVDLVRFAPPPPKPRWIERTHIAEVMAQLTPGSKTADTLTVHALDGNAAVADGAIAAGGLPIRRAAPFRRRAARQGRTAYRDSAGRRRAEGSPRVHGDRDLRELVLPERQQGPELAARKAGRSAFTVYQIRHSFATGLRLTGSDVADIQDLYGHTDPETTMIYAPPQLQKPAAAIEPLERADRAPAGDSAGRDGWQRFGRFRKSFILKDAPVAQSG